MEILSSVSLASNSCACSTSVCSSDFTPTYHTSDHEQQKSTFNHFRTKEGYNPFLLYNTTVNTPKRNLDLLLNLIYAFWSPIWGVIHQGMGPRGMMGPGPPATQPLANIRREAMRPPFITNFMLEVPLASVPGMAK